MASMNFMVVRSWGRAKVSAANGRGAPKAVQSPEIEGLRALEDVTYVTVSDENGRMDDDLFDLLVGEEASAH